MKYIEGGIVGEEVVIVTESATPLYKHDLKQMPALQITAGLSAIMDTLVFLHDRVSGIIAVWIFANCIHPVCISAATNSKFSPSEA